MPSSQCRFAIKPSQATQASCVVAMGDAARISLRFKPIRVPRSSRISQCALPPPWSWSAITSSLHALIMPMRVSQSLQLVATLSFSTEFRWRVLSRCCSANMRARPLLSGSRNQRQRSAKSFTTLSMRATTLMRRIPYDVRNYSVGSSQFQSDAFVPLSLRPDPYNLQASNFRRVGDVGATTRLQVDARDLEQPHAPLAARRRDRHRLHQLRPRVELGVGDPHRPRGDAGAHQFV